MDAVERGIYYYLKHRRSQFISAREIGRGAGSRRKSRVFPDWAMPVLDRMVERGILETGPAGQYRIKPRPRKAGDKCVSPAIAGILKASNKEFPGLTLEADDAYYEAL